MNSTELIASVRQDVFLGDLTHPDYDDARILVELNRTLQTTFTREIVNARQGYWLKTEYVSLVAGSPAVRIPERAVAGALESVAIADSAGGKFAKLDEVTETHAESYELAVGQAGTPQKYVIRGDMVELLPAPSSAGVVCLKYYLTPSTLVVPSASYRITIKVGAVLTFTPALANGVGSYDIVHVGGWNDVVYPEVVTTTAGGITTVSSLPVALDMARIAVGDYLRAPATTDWPQLPNEFHSTLAKLTAVNIMTQLNMLEKKAVTEQNAAYEYQRFTDLLKPRVRAEAEVLKAPRSVLQVGRGR